jgi:uncharacterized protein YbjT (DUF2867 family)
VEIKMNNTDSKKLILVLGGTGNQGGSVARELLLHGYRVRIISRNPDSDAAQLIKNAGAEVSYGDLSRPATLEQAACGVDAAFSVQFADAKDETVEKRNAIAFVATLSKAGVRQIVHTSVNGSNKFPRWDKYEPHTRYMDQKYEIENLFRNGDFDFWTILHPVYFFENFAERFAWFMNPELTKGIIFSAIKPGIRTDMNCSEDMASFARAAFDDPVGFNKKDIDIASDSLTMGEVAEILSRVKGEKVSSLYVSAEEAIKRGLHPGTVAGHDKMNESGYQTDFEALKKYDIPLTSFETWALRHKDEIIINEVRL